ncbi:MAG: UvrD-helicase domain-containing protein [Treponema sp.]|jgi:superfamily I DNA/RNA helicase/PHP family Zn ribbon phosphoesterase|nr:UvrD-helicase domain-containing protein [Treponema sp.]
MRVIADLHIHSSYSRSTGKNISPALLERWGKIKGIDLLGTGDCTHPRWLKELREQLDDAEDGLYTLKDTCRAAFDRGYALTDGLPQPARGLPPRFVLTGEISTIYKKQGRTRKVHHLVILPAFEAAVRFQVLLERVGNIHSDGRPILGIDSEELLRLLLEADERSLLIPAHIWTPWFSALGGNSGFDSIEECYGDLASCIPAIETGLSSNPPMNWALSSLDKFSIISNSDAHSPEKLGREASVLEMDMSYSSLNRALRRHRLEWETQNGATASAAETAGGEGVAATIEFFPQEGKYHYEGHRKCGFYAGPEDASGGICPVCGKALTPGVMGRVLELADRPVDEAAVCPLESGRFNKRPYSSLIPLKELLGELLKTGPSSKKVGAAYAYLIEKTGNEFSLLMNVDTGHIEKLRCPGLSGELLAGAVDRMRRAEVFISPGYDGEYGVIRTFAPGVLKTSTGSAGLFDDEEAAASSAGALHPARGTAAEPRTAYGAGEGGGNEGKRGRRNAAVQTPAEKPVQEKAFSAFTPDADQEKAVSFSGSRGIIIAGPGTGKTAVLTARIVRMMRRGIRPETILAVTFTIKAAAEMRERIAGLVGPDSGITAATFHSFCLSVLREQQSGTGPVENFDILSDAERKTILEALCKAKTEKGRVSPESLGKYIEERKRFLLLPGETFPQLGTGAEILNGSLAEPGVPPAYPPLENLYKSYSEELRTRALLDYDDLIAGTVRLLALNPDLLARYRGRFSHILVDEYQDINFAQYGLIRLLVPGGDTVPADAVSSFMAIGDPNQAIYGFRGSDKRFIDRFIQDYPGAGMFRLSKSFRCAAPITRAAGRLVQVDIEGNTNEVKLCRFAYPTDKSEAEGIARHIAALTGGTSFFAYDSGVTDGAGGAALEDCAVLLRTGVLAGPVIKAMKDHGLPFTLTGEQPWWEDEPAGTILAFLREDRAAKNEGPAADTIKAAWDRLTAQGTIRRTGKALPESLERLLDFALINRDIPSLLDALAVSRTDGAAEVKSRGVKIMTIHAAKGLEFDHVFVPALEEGILPFTLFERSAEKNDPPGKAGLNPADSSQPDGRIQEDEKIAEERRILYVAMTRARSGLYLSWAGSRNFGGRQLKGAVSRFLSELENLVPLVEDRKPRPRNPQGELF